MDELDSFVGGQEVELSDLLPKTDYSLTPPKAAIRNRAATLSLFSENSNEAINKYRTMLSEGERGSFSYTNFEQSNLSQRVEQEDKEVALSMLADPNLTQEQKDAIIFHMREGKKDTDPRLALITEFTQSPSEGETPEAEESRVGLVSRTLKSMREADEQIQALVNAHAASLDDASAKTVLEIAEYLVAPLQIGVASSTLSSSVFDKMTAWEKVKAFILPGSETKALRERLESLPSQERVLLAKRITEALSKSPAILSHNQFAAFDKAVAVFGEGGYDSTDAMLDNIGQLLDVFFMGAGAKALRAKRTLKGEDVPSQTPSVPTVSPEPSKTVSVAQRAPLVMEEDLATVTGRPTAGAYDDLIAELESQKAELLGAAGNQLGRGEVEKLQTERRAIVQSFERSGTEAQLAKDLQKSEKLTSKAAKEKAAKLYAERKQSYEASLARIDGMLEANREASTVMQKVADLEKQIKLLKERNTPIFLKKNPIADAIERIEKNVVTKENPLAPHPTAKQTNPQKARDFHGAIVASTTDEIAEALTGESRDQAIANDVFPQAGTSSGRVTAQPTDIQRDLRQEFTVPERIREHIWSSGRIDITPEEAALARANVVRRFNDASGLKMVESMSTFSRDGGQIKISAMYGTSEGAFLNAKEAVEQAKSALKHLGLKDDEIVLMERQGRDYVPVKLSDVQGDGSYFVRVETKHDIDPTDIVDANGNVQFDNFKVWGNILDRIGGIFPNIMGSMQRHLLDAQSMLDKRLTGAFSGASDKAAKLEEYLLQEASKFSDKYVRLSAKEKAQLDLYLKEANFKEIPFDTTDLAARQFTPKMIEAARSWREYWDGVYYLENFDLVRTFRAQGYKKLESANAALFAKPVAKNRNNSYVYDPEADAMVTLLADEMDALYDMGGTVAKLRRPSDINGEVVEYVVVRNNRSNYLREIRDNDTILNYKEGYYNIQYKAPRFVDEVVLDKAGNPVKRAIAVAGDQLEAQRFAERMARNAAPGTRYEVRADARAMRSGTDDWFDVSSAGGRIAQRHRGKLLEDGAGLNHLGDGSYVMDPVLSAVHAARSIAGRTVSRPVLEYAKARFIAQYGRFLKSDGMGGRLFPTSASDIGEKGMQFSKEVADARTTYEYIRYMENGYINGLDNFFKAAMHTLGWSLGKGATKTDSALLTKMERGFESLSEVAPTQAGKSIVFQAYLAWNPLRQLVVQSHQIVRMYAFNPAGMLDGGVFKLINSFSLDKVLGRTSEFTKFVDESGVMAAVDKQNLVRGSLFDAAEQSSLAKRFWHKTASIPRIVGFDTGERMNMLGHLAAVYDKFIKDGRNMADKVVREEAYAKARALSYSMNYANDMPYNQNSLGIVMQFLQVPHKGITQVFNKQLTKGERARLAGFDLLFFGGPTLLISELLGADILPDNPELREFLVFGLESMILNASFRTIFKDESINIDFSSLAPTDITGFSDFFTAVLEEGWLSVLSNSPAGQLFGDQGRIPTAVRSVLRFAGVTEPLEETPDQFKNVLSDVLSISSGFSNGMKAHLALKTGQRYDKYGQLLDDNTHPFEAVMEAFGFSDASRRDLFASSRVMQKKIKDHKDDVIRDSKILLNYLSSRLENVQSGDARTVEQIQRTMAFALSKYEKDPVAMQIFHQQMVLRLRDPQEGLMRNMLRAAGLPNSTEIKDAIRMSPISEDQKQKILQIVEDANNLRGE